MLTFGSLFAGIGGFDLGLERAGMRCLWQSEIDGYCQRVLEKHWPDVFRVPDVRDVNAETVPWVDVICGGSPCQGFSGAGLGLGLQDERSALWFEMLRVVRDLRPRYVIVENVSALLVRGFDVVLGGLAACGYDAEWDCIPASAVGAPHQRDRLWLVAYPHGEGEHAVAVDAEVAGAPEPLADASRDLPARPTSTGAERERARPGGQRGGVGEDWWSVEPGVGRVAHGVPARVDRLRSLGNSLVPQIAEWIGRRIVAYEEGRVAA